MKTLVLVSNSFPLGGVTESAFILPEIKYLAREFDRVIIAPLTCVNEKNRKQVLPENVKVSKCLLINKTLKEKLRGLLRLPVSALKDCLANPADSGASLAYSAYTGISIRNLRKLIKEEKLDLKETLFYTFWFDFTTTALSMIPGAKFITRAHGYDLYEDRGLFISSYRRKKTFAKMLKCYPVSEAGKKYLSEHYPLYKDKILFRKLGSQKPEGLNPEKGEDDADIVIVSIARTSPEKGTERQLRLLNDYAGKNQDKKIRYIHFGDGPLMHLLKELAQNCYPNLSIEIKGNVSNKEIHGFLERNHVDLTLLLSHSEGLPVSLMESISYGIPFVATNVGGIPEILPKYPQLIISKNPTPDEFVRAIDTVIDDKSLRKKVREEWENNFSSDILRADFAGEISSL